MKNTIIKFLGVLILILGLGLIFNVNADANKSSLADILKFQSHYEKSGDIKHGGKTYSFWTTTDKKALDGGERKIVAISVYEKNTGKTIEQYFINYYQDGELGYVKLLEAKDPSKGNFTVEINPTSKYWYSERFFLWEKNRNGKDWFIGKWKRRSTKEWTYGAYTIDRDTNKSTWESFGTSITDLKSKSNLGKKEKKRLFQDGQKRGREAEKIFNLLSKLEKKYYAKISKEDPNKIVKKTNKEEVPKEQKVLEIKLETALEELERVKKELAEKEKEGKRKKVEK